MAKFERVKYVGDGTSYLLGVPATDLDGDAWYALPTETRETALRLKLYEGVGKEDDKPAPVAVSPKVADAKPAGGG